MRKEGKAREIIEQGGSCDGIACDFGEQNECPIFRMCELSGGNSCKSESKVSACREFIGSMQPSKTLLDEFAMAAMQGLVVSAFKHLSEEKASGPVTEGAMAIMKDVGATAYLIATAMMKERARRDEMGNVKEVK